MDANSLGNLRINYSYMTDPCMHTYGVCTGLRKVTRIWLVVQGTPNKLIVPIDRPRSWLASWLARKQPASC
jgi:hypothetical protein